jgi:hypothetical protein
MWFKSEGILWLFASGSRCCLRRSFGQWIMSKLHANFHDDKVCLLWRWMDLSNSSCALGICRECKLHRKIFSFANEGPFHSFIFSWWMAISINVKHSMKWHIYFSFSCLHWHILKSLVAFADVLSSAWGPPLKSTTWSLWKKYMVNGQLIPPEIILIL